MRQFGGDQVFFCLCYVSHVRKSSVTVDRLTAMHYRESRPEGYSINWGMHLTPAATICSILFYGRKIPQDAARIRYFF